MKYQDHKYAKLFPLMDGAELLKLAEDFEIGGQREKIVLHEDKILDGRNRFRACQLKNREPLFRTFDIDKEGDPLNFVISKNLTRRHLTESQRAAIAADLATQKNGGGETFHPENLTVDQAAKVMNVSNRSVQKAKRVKEHSPSKHEQVREGKKSVTAALGEIKAKEEKKHEEHLDKTGHPIPKGVIDAWLRAEAFQADIKAIRALELKLEKGRDSEDVIFHYVGQDTVSMLKNARLSLSQILPYTVCTYCEGDGCKVCKKTGWLSKLVHDTGLPPEKKRKEK